MGPAGARAYRTGDLARYREDGTLEFIGRCDHQVKVRGHRIELGEIETWLLRHPSVTEAVAIVREDVPDDRRLVAYIVSTDEALSASALRPWLSERLPDYMVPSAIVPMPAMPLTANGKIDRRALPLPDSTRGRDDEAARRADADRGTAL